MQWIKRLFTIVCLATSLMVGAVEPGKININTATAAELAALNGIGKVKAEAIVQYRNQAGEFKSLDELTLIKGIGPAILSKNKELLTLE